MTVAHLSICNLFTELSALKFWYRQLTGLSCVVIVELCCCCCRGRVDLESEYIDNTRHQRRLHRGKESKLKSWRMKEEFFSSATEQLGPDPAQRQSSRVRAIRRQVSRSSVRPSSSRNRGARRWNQKSRDNNSICHLHRRMTVLLGAGWQDSW